MGLELRVNRQSNQPIYLQIAEQIRGQIRDGRLPSGTKLPPIRQLASTLGVTRPTVESAYDELRSNGYVETTVGRGTFVAEMAEAHEMIDTLGWNLTPDGVLQDMPLINQIPVMRSFAFAEPDASLFPIDEFWGAMNHLRADGPDFLRYIAPQGDPELRIELVNLLRERGIEAIPDDIIVTSGATQAQSLVMHALTRPGDYVAVEEPSHICLLDAIKAYRLNPVGIPVDDHGLRIDMLEQVITQYKPRVLFTVPNFHNPTGVLMSDDRRRKLLELAHHHGMIVVEDDVYGVLSFDNPAPPSLKSLDESEMVVYVNSFSKVLMNGLRLGYMVAPRMLHRHLMQLKHAADICTSPLMQRTMRQFLRAGRYKSHLRRVLPVYVERRNAILNALQTYMPEGVTWTEPQGGMFTWLTLPPQVDGHVLHRDMLRQGFAFTPGDVFFTTTNPNAHMRICFAGHTPYVIHEAVQVLANAIRKELRTGPPPPYFPPMV